MQMEHTGRMVITAVCVGMVFVGSGCYSPQLTPKHAQAFQQAKTIGLETAWVGDEFNMFPAPKGEKFGLRGFSGLTMFNREKGSNGPVGFVTAFLEALGYTVVDKKQKADANLTMAYGTIFQWRPDKSSVTPARKVSKAEFIGDFWIDCRGAKSFGKMYRASLPGSGQVYALDAMPEREAQDAYKASGFEPGVVASFRQLCGPERVAAALKKMGRADLL